MLGLGVSIFGQGSYFSSYTNFYDCRVPVGSRQHLWHKFWRLCSTLSNIRHQMIWNSRGDFGLEVRLIGFRLFSLTLMVQAAVLCGFHFDERSFGQDGFATTKIDVSRCQVADPLVVAVVVVVIDEGGDGGFNLPVEEVVLGQEVVLQGLV
jgi:hypothetical protein